MSTSTKHVTAYYIDAKDGRPATEAPLRHGPALPDSALKIDAVDRRKNPALIIGQMPIDAPIKPPITLISEKRHVELLSDYHAWRDELTAEARQDTLNALASYRFEIETGGIDINGQKILTDRESQSQLTAAYQALAQPFIDSIDWKSGNGWITVTESELRQIAQLIARHVQGCFTAEKQVANRIENGEILDIQEAFDYTLSIIKNENN